MSTDMTETALRLLDRALTAMNEAVAMTAEKGPAVAMEFIADFLNDGDAVDEEMAFALADDWLTRWMVARNEPKP